MTWVQIMTYAHQNPKKHKNVMWVFIKTKFCFFEIVSWEGKGIERFFKIFIFRLVYLFVKLKDTLLCKTLRVSPNGSSLCLVYKHLFLFFNMFMLPAEFPIPYWELTLSILKYQANLEWQTYIHRFSSGYIILVAFLRTLG